MAEQKKTAFAIADRTSHQHYYSIWALAPAGGLLAWEVVRSKDVSALRCESIGVAVCISHVNVGI